MMVTEPTACGSTHHKRKYVVEYLQRNKFYEGGS